MAKGVLLRRENTQSDYYQQWPAVTSRTDGGMERVVLSLCAADGRMAGRVFFRGNTLAWQTLPSAGARCVSGRMYHQRDRFFWSTSDLSLAKDYKFARGQFLKSHRTIGMQFGSTDANLCPQSELSTIVEPGGGVHHYS